MPVIMSKIKPTACRRLQFDDDDEDGADQNGQDVNNDHSNEETAYQNLANASLEEFRRRNREENARRWNFDFQTETPLPGPYEWVRLEPEQNIVVASTTTTLVEACVTTIETQQNVQNDLTEAMDCDVAVAASTTTTTKSAIPPNESSTSDTLENEQMTTPTKGSQ